MKRRRSPNLPLWRLDGFFWACVILVVGFAYLACVSTPDVAGGFFGAACLIGVAALGHWLHENAEGDDSDPW